MINIKTENRCIYKTKQILSVFFLFLLFLSVFDMLRSGFNIFFFLPETIFRLFNIAISAFRDILLFILLFFISVHKKVINYKHSFFFAVILVICQYIICIINSIYNQNFLTIFINIRYLYWYIRPFMFLYILFNKKIFFTYDDLFIIKKIIIWSLCVFILTIILYTIFPFTIVGMRQYPRIGIGNMSIQSLLYYCAFMILVYFQPFNTIFNSICALLFICAILLTITNTGIIAISVSSFILLFSKRTRKIIIPVYIFGFYILLAVFVKYHDELNFFIDLLVKRSNEISNLINKLFFPEKDIFVSSSLGFRERQIDYFLTHLTIYDIPFGSGEFTLSKAGGIEILENFYFALFHDFGLAGLFIFAYIFLKLLKMSFFDLLSNKNIFSITVLIGFCLYSTTLSFVSNYSMSCLFMLTFYMTYFRRYCNT